MVEAPPQGERLDALEEILRSLRLETGLVSRAVLSQPWSVHTTGTPWAVFHAILRGHAWVTVEGEPPLQLAPGDLLLIPRGEPHALSDRPGVPSRHIAGLPMVTDGTCVAKLVHGGGGPTTEILCGSFLLRQSAAQDALVRMLPRLLRICAAEAPLASWLETNVALLGPDLEVARPGASAIVAGVTDVLFMRALRAWASRPEVDAAGWLAALRDPGIASSLAALHTEPGADWTVESLARRAGMSRTLFHERFKELVGETPSRYLASWRMHLATDLLARQPERSVAEIGLAVGYASEDAFCKAFRRAQGMSPSAWRRRRLAS